MGKVVFEKLKSKIDSKVPSTGQKIIINFNFIKNIACLQQIIYIFLNRYIFLSARPIFAILVFFF